MMMLDSHCRLPLAEKRKVKGFTQLMLARKIGMSPVQLCKIEKGYSSPTLATLERIAAALDIPLTELLSSNESNARECATVRVSDTDGSRFYPVRYGGDDRVDDAVLLKKILPAENRICSLERELNLSQTTLLPFVHSLKIDPFGAKTVARYMRAACAVGAASFSDLVELLEFRNVRLHSLAMPAGVSSRAYFNVDNHSLSILLSQKNTPERSIYRIAYELAWMAISGSMGFKPVREGAARHRFARVFASEFLMPEESVRFAVSQLGIGPGDWTFDMVVWLKSKFNVSAEAFALRLEDLSLISVRLRQKIREELRQYYKAHPKAMEPEPCLPPLRIGLREGLLAMEVGRKELKG
jgi:transcriptional regulator with XRE-family HTH domain/Zn-dependent peptidase ImmA (M78 family)